jgi:hypothetical protein
MRVVAVVADILGLKQRHRAVQAAGVLAVQVLVTVLLEQLILVAVVAAGPLAITAVPVARVLFFSKSRILTQLRFLE